MENLNKELMEYAHRDLSKLRKPGTPWGWHGAGDFESLDGVWTRELLEDEPDGTVIFINEPVVLKNA